MGYPESPPRVQGRCKKQILLQKRERCCSLCVTGDLEAVITLLAICGPLFIGSSSRVRCNIDGVRRCRVHCLCSLRWRSYHEGSCKSELCFCIPALPVIMLPCVPFLLAVLQVLAGLGSFGSIAVVNCVAWSLEQVLQKSWVVVASHLELLSKQGHQLTERR